MRVEPGFKIKASCRRQPELLAHFPAIFHRRTRIFSLSAHPAYRVKYSGIVTKLQRQHRQVQPFSGEWPVHENLQPQYFQVQSFLDECPVHDHDNLLPDSGHILKGLKIDHSASTEVGAKQTTTSNQMEELRYGIQTLLD